MLSLYILALKGGKFYVGKTRNLTLRIQEHWAKQGAAWTKKYPPLRLEKAIPNIDDFDEDKWVKIYMNKYGTSAVRGGTYSRITLTDAQHHFLQQEIWAATGRCLLCGQNTHFAKDCPQAKN